MKISDIIKLPVKYDSMGTMIIDSDNNLICDIRGWGRFQYMEEGEKVQDSVGRYIADAINDKIESDSTTDIDT